MFASPLPHVRAALIALALTGSAQAQWPEVSRAQPCPSPGSSTLAGDVSGKPRGASASWEWSEREVWLAGVSRRVWVPAEQSSRGSRRGARPGSAGPAATRHQRRAGRYVWVNEPGRYEVQAVRVRRERAEACGASRAARGTS